MLHNWKNFALNELFAACGSDLLNKTNERRLYEMFGVLGVSRLKRACLAYRGKLMQLFELHNYLSTDKLIVVDYDVFVRKKEKQLPELYRFIELPYRQHYSDMIHSKSISKHSLLTRKEREMVEKTCNSIYQRASNLVTILP
jgi:hypothetical protein